jgi:hypothetical protein
MIDQEEGNPSNYQIDNFADIYFDFNPPVRTNTAIRTVGEVALSVSTSHANDQLLAYPIPANDMVTFVLPEEWKNNHYSYILYDMMGRKMNTSTGSTRKFTTSVSPLSNGIYLAVFQSKDGKIARTTIVVE